MREARPRPGVRVVLATIAVTALFVAGCASARADTPMAGAHLPAPAVTEPPSVTVSIHACGLLTESEIQELGLVSRGANTLGGSHGCSWTKTGQYVVSFAVWDHLGISHINSGGNPITNHPVGSYDGRQYLGFLGGCAISIEITPSSRVDVVVSDSGYDTGSCDLAELYATLIAPRLPAEHA